MQEYNGLNCTVNEAASAHFLPPVVHVGMMRNQVTEHQQGTPCATILSLC